MTREQTEKSKDVLTLSIKLKSGRFATELAIPFPCSPEEAKDAMERWLQFAEIGLKIGATEMNADWEKPE